MVTHSASSEGGRSRLRCWPKVFSPDSLQSIWRCIRSLRESRINFLTSPRPLNVTPLCHFLFFFNTLSCAVIPGGSAGVSSSVHPIHRSPGRPRASSSGDGRAVENGIIGGRSGARVRGVMPDHWELAFSDPGESHYIEWVSDKWAQFSWSCRELDEKINTAVIIFLEIVSLA